MIKLNKVFIVIVLLTVTIFGFSQSTTNNPYSRYGLGILRPEGFLQSFAMGGIGLGLRSNRYMNSINPASYSALAVTSFEMGFTNNGLWLTDGFESEFKNNAYISHISFGMPIMKNKWGLGFGLVPYSNVGYSYTTNVTDSIAGDVSYINNGDGGLNKVYLTNALMFKMNSRFDPFSLILKPFEVKRIKKIEIDSLTGKPINNRENKKLDSLIIDPSTILSFGVNGYFMFGSLNQDEKAIFGSLSNGLNLWNLQQTNVSDFGVDFGFQYQKSFTMYREKHRILFKEFDFENYTQKKKKRINRRINRKVKNHNKNKEKKYNLTFGATYGLAADLDSKHTDIVRTFTGSSDFGTIKDTISFVDQEKSVTQIPGKFGVGISLGRANKWTLGVDFNYSNWGKIQSNSTIFNYNNNYAIATGFEYIPKFDAFASYFKRINYRIGARYNTSYIMVNNQELTEYGITFGVGLPIKRTGTAMPSLNLGIEYGSRGQIENGLIKETFINFNIGLTINDRWFVHRKYD